MDRNGAGCLAVGVAIAISAVGMDGAMAISAAVAMVGAIAIVGAVAKDGAVMIAAVIAMDGAMVMSETVAIVATMANGLDGVCRQTIRIQTKAATRSGR